MVESDASAALTPPLLACAQGDVPPNVALMQLLAKTPNEAAARLALQIAEANAVGEIARRRIREIQQYWDGKTDVFPLVKQIATAASRSADWAATFDEVAQISPEAAVALYSLGNPCLLSAATRELVNQLHAWGLLSPESCVLDLGCGFGRVTQAIAKDVRHVVALEISKRMVELARTALADHENVLVVRSAGDGLSFLRDASLDVVLAIDSFPYLIDCDLASRHLGDIARALKPAGRLLIMNFSYRGDLALDRSEVGRFADVYHFAIERNGTAELSLWDGRAFLLRRM
jgi:SAM-dependent methyltransferase